jgi:hypothetical protein
MAEVLARFAEPATDDTGRQYRAQACGAPMPDGLWEGWIEFEPLDGGAPIRSPRETTQPNLKDAAYWASGLTAIYLEGALSRAMNPMVRRAPPAAEPLFDGPAEDHIVSTPRPVAFAEAVLDPFSVYEKGEVLLRKELGALSPWHLVNIIRAYRLSSEPLDVLNALSGVALADIIVEAVRRHSARQSRAAR